MILKQCDRPDAHAAHRWFDEAFRVWTCEGVPELTPAERIAEHRGDDDWCSCGYLRDHAGDCR